jgi:hypothetical protein
VTLNYCLKNDAADVQKSRHGLGDGDWWGAELEVPATAAVLDFVLSDGAQVGSSSASHGVEGRFDVGTHTHGQTYACGFEQSA